MKYGLRAILLAHKVIKGKIEYSAVPEERKDAVDRYLTDKGKSDLIVTEESTESTPNSTPEEPSENPTE